MRFLFLTVDYPEFVESLTAARPELATLSYGEQLEARNSSLFGVADFYTAALQRLGHEAEDVPANNEPLQRAWERERLDQPQAPSPRPSWSRFVPSSARRALRPLLRIAPRTTWFEELLVGRIESERPDVLVNQDIVNIPPALIARVRASAEVVVGMHNATVVPDADYSVYDLVLSAYPPTIEEFRSRGVRAEYLPMAFEPRILDRLGEHSAPPTGATFVGSLFPNVHASRVRFLEELCTLLPDVMEVWTPSVDMLPVSSAIRRCHRGAAWGRTMYEVLRGSAATVNHHGDIRPFAHNCRLFEATGVGTLLLTDALPQLDTLFEPGAEVLAYSSAEECAELIRAHLLEPASGCGVAKAGQRRTLADHTYLRRMQDFVEIVQA